MRRVSTTCDSGWFISRPRPLPARNATVNERAPLPGTNATVRERASASLRLSGKLPPPQKIGVPDHIEHALILTLRNLAKKLRVLCVKKPSPPYLPATEKSLTVSTTPSDIPPLSTPVCRPSVHARPSILVRSDAVPNWHCCSRPVSCSKRLSSSPSGSCSYPARPRSPVCLSPRRHAPRHIRSACACR